MARQNVSRWHARWRQGGLKALASRGPTGPDPRLDDQQLHDLDQALRQGARAYGFDSDHWTLERITTVIERLTGTITIAATPGSCCAAWAGGCSALPGAPWSVTSRPSPAGWLRTGLRICRNARRRRAVIVDESGASLLPVVRRSWAPRGHTPVIRHHFNWRRASMAVALCYGSLGGGASVCFHHQHGAYDTDTLIGALGELRVFLGGQKATLVWDGLPAHRSKAMAAWLGRQRSWLVVEPLPGYAPELNPVEGLWASLKGVELANLAGNTLDDVMAAANRGIQRIRDTHHLAFSFLRHSGLSLW